MLPSRGGRLIALARLIDIFDTVGEVPEIAAAAIAFGIPIVRQLDLRVVIAGGGEEDQREATLLAVHPPHFLESEQLEEGDRRRGVGHADHRMETRCSARPGSLIGEPLHQVNCRSRPPTMRRHMRVHRHTLAADEIPLRQRNARVLVEDDRKIPIGAGNRESAESVYLRHAPRRPRAAAA
eukprot:gene19322-19723_t